MPLYEYLCGECRETCELLVRDRETPICPNCESARLEKQLSVPAAHRAGDDLPVCPPLPQNCGRPACGMGGCQFE